MNRAGAVVAGLVLVAASSGVARAGEPAAGVYVGQLATPVGAPIESTGTVGGVLQWRQGDRWGASLAVGDTAGALESRVAVVRWLGDPAPYVRPFAEAGCGPIFGDHGPGFLGEAGFGLDAETFPVLDLRAEARFRAMELDGAVPSALFVDVGVVVHPRRSHDSDHDGIVDLADRCPADAEDADDFEDEDGCPDADNDEDGVPDVLDWCRNVPEDVDGEYDQDGCPDVDNDLDGVPDTDDICPNVAEDEDGFGDDDGCPDLDDDTDGVRDATDQCRFEPETRNGYEDDDGCPDVIPADLARLVGKIDGIGFQAGTDDLLPGSSRILDAAVDVLQSYPDVAIEIEGHTDDVGDWYANLALSQWRAEAVARWLVEHGVDRTRIVADGYGSTRPIVPNTTESNRSRNRRVEIRLVPYDN